MESGLPQGLCRTRGFADRYLLMRTLVSAPNHIPASFQSITNEIAPIGGSSSFIFRLLLRRAHSPDEVWLHEGVKKTYSPDQRNNDDRWSDRHSGLFLRDSGGTSKPAGFARAGISFSLFDCTGRFGYASGL